MRCRVRVLEGAMRIDWRLDADATPRRPLGEIRIVDDDGGEIDATATCLDVWFARLLASLASDAAVSADPVDEAYLLEVRRSERGVRVTYKEGVVTASTTDEWSAVVLSSAERFFEEMRERSRRSGEWSRILAEIEHALRVR